MDELELFAVAIAIADPVKRAQLLDRECAGRPDLRRRLDQLLDAHARSNQLFDAPRHLNLDETKVQPTSEQPGELIAGRYKLLELIGEGGMGAVWAAEQLQPVRRKVALKLIKAGMDSRTVLARFEQERQALAMMDHPNIAKVLDGGLTDRGRPYFVMEYVKGVPITDYCDAARLSVSDRLSLFIQVCQAVQHAHQKGIIHRDLKPSNILVAPYDDKPVPKIIDFGLAKAMHQSLTEHTLHTAHETVLGTPLYMSPEQAQLNNLDIDTRSDIYSLGVLLYELLTGTTPLEKQRFKEAAWDEVRRIIREEEPPKPSTRLSTVDKLPSLASCRQTEPARLTKQVRGDLDWIVMKALEKQRTRRYETANGFAMDVQRYLAGEPVTAVPPSVGYRLRKFVGRNGRTLAISSALALSLLAGLTATLFVQFRADRERAVRNSSADASVAAAAREAAERTTEAWKLVDFPDRMQQAVSAAQAALQRGDEFATTGTPAQTTAAELGSARQEVVEVARHSRLISAYTASMHQYAVSLNEGNGSLSPVILKELREFGLDPVERSTDEIAQKVSESRVRDTLLAILLRCQLHAKLEAYSPGVVGAAERKQADANLPHLNAAVRAVRKRCGGAYARWQDLLDRKDVGGLKEFAASPAETTFGASLYNFLGRDLRDAGEKAAWQAYLRRVVNDGQPDPWQHYDLADACRSVQPPDDAEALRHDAAACALSPNSAGFHLFIAKDYLRLNCPAQAVAEYRKAASISPGYGGLAALQIGDVFRQKRDWEQAIAAYRDAIRLLPELRLSWYLMPNAYYGLGVALRAAGRQAEAETALRKMPRLARTFAREYLEYDPEQFERPKGLDSLRLWLMRRELPALAFETLRAALDKHPDWVKDPRNSLRYNAACAAMNVADGKGIECPPPVERPAFRKNALELLEAEFVLNKKLAAKERDEVHRRIEHWLQDEDWASVRDPKSAEKLPAEERDAWNKLWVEVRRLADATAPTNKKP